MTTTLIIIGVACIIAAIVGGGVKLGGTVEVGEVKTLWRQMTLAAFGGVLIFVGSLPVIQLAVKDAVPKTPKPYHSPSVAMQVPAPKPQVSAPLSRRSTAFERRPIASARASLTTEAQAKLPPAPIRNSEAKCQRFASSSASEWSANYLRPTQIGFYHIFVQTLDVGATEEDADQAVRAWQKRFAVKGIAFARMGTISSNGENERWAVVMGRGLDADTAAAMVTFAHRCGISSRAYSYKQDF